MHRRWYSVFSLLFLIGSFASAQDGLDRLLIYDEEQSTLKVQIPGREGETTLMIDGQETRFRFSQGLAPLERSVDRKGFLISIRVDEDAFRLYHCSRRKNGQVRLIQIPLWLSILPPLVAIGLALLFKEVIISLFIGVWAGAFIAGGLRMDSWFYFLVSFMEVVEKYVIQALADSGHLSVIVFSLLIGGMVAIISRNGGMAGVVKALSRYAASPRSAQFITWLLGVAIFFDDYANTLIVGNTMRSVTDKFRISREKLAYIVDSTAAPVAAVAFITTWIGAELGYIDGGISQISNFPYSMTPYAIFISSLKYSFYPILTLCFILILVHSERDYGPMLNAEERARTTGQVSSAATPDEDEPNMEDLSPVKGAPLKWQHAFFPVLLVILMTIMGLVSTGMDSLYGEIRAVNPDFNNENWGAIWRNLGIIMEGNDGFLRKVGQLIGASDSYVALLWASLSGVILAILITVYNKTMNVLNTIHSLVTGFKTMMPALIILTLAWSLAQTTVELHTATYLSSSLQDFLNPYIMPVLVFVLSALIAFSTGSSWSTMAILYPIVIPTTWVICQSNGLSEEISLEILLNVISIVLGASVMGDHCSPISDTTILSSLASDCNHIDHVRTQLPYALTVGVFSILCGGASTLLGGGWLLSFMLFLVSLAGLYFVIQKFGTRIPEPSVK